jgi:hypothetical protein
MTETEHYQGMTRPVVARLLAMAQAYDRRFIPEEADVLAFHDVAVTHRWTAHEMEIAIRKWGGDRGQEEWLDPSTLNRLIRTARQDAMMRQPVATAFGPTMAEETVRQRVMALYRDAAQDAKAECARRRAMVLKHEDLKAALCAPTVGYTRADQWNGFIPPPTIPSPGEGATGPTTETGTGFMKNMSPRRQALILIVEEAERREKEAT